MPDDFIKLYYEMKKENTYELSEDIEDLWSLLQSILLYLQLHNGILNKECINQYFGLLLTGLIYKGVNIHAANVVSDYYTSEDDCYKKAMRVYDNYRLKSIMSHCKVDDGILALCQMRVDLRFSQICRECIMAL